MKKPAVFPENDILWIALSLALSLPALVLSRLDLLTLPFDPALVAVILCGVPILSGALEGLINRFDILADLPAAVAVTMLAAERDYFIAGTAAFLILVGKFAKALLLHRTQVKTEATSEIVKTKSITASRRWAGFLTAGAIAAAGVVWILSGEISRAVSILASVSFGILTPAAVAAVMGVVKGAAADGVIIMKADAPERLAAVTDIAFGIGGALTAGAPEVTRVDVLLDSLTQKDVLLCAAAAETRSTGPIAKSLVRAYEELYGDNPGVPEGFSQTAGRGVIAVLRGHAILTGNAAMLGEAGFEPPARDVDAEIFVTMDGTLIGRLALEDEPRPEAPKMVEAMKAMDLRPILLTAKSAGLAQKEAERCGIREVRAACMPEDKGRAVEVFEREGRRLFMIGGGLLDAPALSAAWISAEVDPADETQADFVLLDGGLEVVLRLVKRSRRMKRTLRISLILSAALNLAAIALAAVGLLRPVGAAAANCIAVMAIVLLSWPRPDRRRRKRNEGL